jgi:hypothetical protein
MEALGAIGQGSTPRPSVERLGPLLVAAAIALAMGFAVERTGLLLLEFVPDERSYPFFGLMQGLSRALAAPFFLVTLVTTGATTHRRVEKTPELY